MVKPIHKAAKVARFLLATRRSKNTPVFVSQLAQINHQHGIINYVNSYPHSVLTFATFNGKAQSIYVVLNPDKLKRVGE